MPLPYHHSYNADVIAAGYSYNTEAGDYLDNNVQNTITTALQECLSKRPSRPITFLAKRLLSNNATPKQKGEASCGSGESADGNRDAQLQSFTISINAGAASYPCPVDPLAAEFQRKITTVGAQPLFQEGCPVKGIPSLQSRVALSTLELQSLMEQMHHFSPGAPLLVLIEPPTPEMDVFFLGEIPYSAPISETLRLQQQHERKYGVRPASAEASHQEDMLAMEDVHLERERTITGVLRERLGDQVKGFNEAIETLRTTVPSMSLIILPRVQSSYLTSIESIDDAITAAAMPLQSNNEGLSLLFVSYNPQSYHVTLTRVLCSYFPYYDAQQRQLLKQFRQSQVEIRKMYSMDFVMKYWATVQERRHQSDLNCEPSRRSGEAQAVSASKVFTGEAAAPLSKEAAERSKASEKKAKRQAASRKIVNQYSKQRQAEDDVFLSVVRQIRNAAAILIQGLYRGYRVRKDLQRKGTYTGREGTLAAMRSYDALLPPPLPENLPPLLKSTVDRLQQAIPSVFQNYPVIPVFPDVVRRTVYRPVQHSSPMLGEGADSEGVVPGCAPDSDSVTVEEKWVAQEVLIPPLRCTELWPHVNLLHRLREYLYLAGCTILDDAMKLLRDYSGMSVLQRRAYEHLKSLSLTVFFIAFKELHVRHKVSAGVRFSSFVHQYFAEAAGWFSMPHFTSTILCAPVGDRENRARHFIDGLFASQESILVPGVPSSREKGKDTQHDVRHALKGVIHRIAPNILIVTAPFLPATDLEELLRHFPKTSSAPTAASMNSKLHITWWSISPLPACYIDGKPLVLLPRRENQEVEDCASFDEFVLRQKPLKSTPLVVVTSTLRTAPSDILDRTFSISQRGSLSSSVTEGNLLSLLSSMHSITIEDADNALCRKLSTDGDTAAITFFTSPSVTTLSYVGLANCSRLHREVLRRRGFVYSMPKANTNQSTELEDGVGSPTTGFAATVQNLYDSSTGTFGGSPLASRQRRRSLQRGDRWEKVMETVINSDKSTSAFGSRRSSILPYRSTGSLAPSRGSSARSSCGASPIRNDSFNLTKTLTEVSQRQSKSNLEPTTSELTSYSVETVKDLMSSMKTALGAAADADIVELKHIRPWLLPFSGEGWLRRFSSFVVSIAHQLKCEDEVVLAMEEPSQSLYAAAACIATFRIIQPPREQKELSLTRKASTFYTPASEKPRLSPLSYFDDFYSLLEESRKSDAGTIVDSRKQVDLILNSATTRESLNFKSRIRFHIKQAEFSVDKAKCTANILAAVQLSEHLAWLFLLDLYFASSPVREWCASRHSGIQDMIFQLPSFDRFAESFPGILQWITDIDPWKYSPELSPDIYHQRYTNALRRWDSKNYVCFGAL